VIVRIFFSAVDPSDVPGVQQIVSEDVRPAFDAAGCRSVELLVSTEPNAGGLVEGLVISHWNSQAEFERALESREVSESLVRVRQLLRLEPITRMFDVLE
jgi:quinol monooxygenase YgiN